MMKKIAVIGEILVEIMADTIGEGFDGPQSLTGPFPSGAPAIFADQAAKLGQPVGIISGVGDDDFGRINLERLKRDGVDISGVRLDRDRPTGSAFVRYRPNGSRDFVFNIKHSACGRLNTSEKVNALVESTDHLHIMGSSLSDPEFVRMNITSAETIKSRGGTVSFDPNIRKEMLSAPGMRDAMKKVVRMTDLYLPSGGELTLLTDAKDETGAIAELLSLGVRAIVHKNGAVGARFHDENGVTEIASFHVDEIDPTGAGDSFGGAFTTHWLRGASPKEALTYAAAAGALAVTKRGPMEGVSSHAQIETFLKSTRIKEATA